MQNQPDNRNSSSLADILEFSTVDVLWDPNNALLDSLDLYTPICHMEIQPAVEPSSQPFHQDNHELVDTFSQQDDPFNSSTFWEFLMSTSAQVPANDILDLPAIDNSNIDILDAFFQVNNGMGMTNSTLPQASHLLIPPTGHDTEGTSTRTQNIEMEDFMRIHGIPFDLEHPAEETMNAAHSSSSIPQVAITDLGAPPTPDDESFSTSTHIYYAPNPDIDRLVDRWRLQLNLERLLRNTTKSHLPQRAGWLEPTLLYITILPYITANPDLPLRFCPPEQEAIETEDQRIACRLQGHITAHSPTSFSFSDTKCRYTTHQYNWRTCRRSKYLMHVLNDHLGFSGVELSRDKSGHFELSVSNTTQICRELIARIVLSNRQYEEPPPCDEYDDLGFLSPLLVFLSILGERSTEDIIERAIPATQRPDPPFPHRNSSNKTSSTTCQLEAYISERGQAKWINMDQPCGQLIVGIDNYRRHLIEQHFGIKRGKGDIIQRTWDRLLAAIRANMRLQDKAKATNKSRKSAL